MQFTQTAEVRTNKGTNYTALHTGSMNGWDGFTLAVPAANRTLKGKLFIKEYLDLTAMQISINKLPVGASVPFCHKHKQNEEAFIFVSGTGQMQIDGDTIEVSEGTIVRVAPDGNRTLRNTGNAPLNYVCIQAKANSLTQDTFDDGIKDENPVQW